jgi:molybdopterin synthase catalytic subunit
VLVEPEGDAVWVALTTDALSFEQASAWVTVPECGAVVVFGGTVRDHAEGRPGVSELEYEAYVAQVEPRLKAIASAAYEKWDGLGRMVLWHRIGTMKVSECSVIVAASAGHREQAFEAARYGIDSIKSGVPIWKRERWQGGEDWGLDAHDLLEVGP